MLTRRHGKRSFFDLLSGSAPAAHHPAGTSRLKAGTPVPSQQGPPAMLARPQPVAPAQGVQDSAQDDGTAPGTTVVPVYHIMPGFSLGLGRRQPTQAQAQAPVPGPAAQGAQAAALAGRSESQGITQGILAPPCGPTLQRTDNRPDQDAAGLQGEPSGGVGPELGPEPGAAPPPPAPSCPTSAQPPAPASPPPRAPLLDAEQQRHKRSKARGKASGPLAPGPEAPPVGAASQQAGQGRKAWEDLLDLKAPAGSSSSSAAVWCASPESGSKQGGGARRAGSKHGASQGGRRGSPSAAGSSEAGKTQDLFHMLLGSQP